ncbi:hypothetical protein [Microcoleus sp. FACHB-68]|uniref:hypothetical protein n=1 Tax=Microcoleus sp. FACHB-68 TaxID=2692826 RepID=UPI0016879887|nr:hypothetical protein [Microcoleus sp. FACHB-68]MBD1938923.1 hypothetical protein [Microcoleus sp. FACHB-68]
MGNFRACNGRLLLVMLDVGRRALFLTRLARLAACVARTQQPACVCRDTITEVDIV